MLAATDNELSVGDYEDALSEAADKCHVCDGSGNESHNQWELCDA